MDRPIKLTFLGAGSFFAPRLVNDVIRIPGNQGGVIALVDIDAARLTLSAKLVRKLVGTFGGGKWKVVASTERREVLKKTDYLVNCIEVSGLECVVHDNDIPLKYGSINASATRSGRAGCLRPCARCRCGWRRYGTARNCVRRRSC